MKKLLGVCTVIAGLALSAIAGTAPLQKVTAATPKTEAARTRAKYVAHEQKVADIKALKAEMRAAQAAGQDMSALRERMRALQGTPATGRQTLDQGGDNCGTATAITGLPYEDAGTTIGYTDDYAGDVFCIYSDGAPDVVYAYTPDADQTVTVSLLGSYYDTGLHIWAGCPTSDGVQIACIDDACGLLSCLGGVSLSGGVTYYIIVDGFSDYAGDYRLRMFEGNDCDCAWTDQCSYAEYVEVGSSVTFSTANATDDDAGTCGTEGPIYQGMWYYVIGDGTTLTATTCNDGTDDIDTKLQVFTGNCEALICVNGNDDDGGDCNLLSRVTWCSEPGVTYYILAGGYSEDDWGQIQLSVSSSGVYCTCTGNGRPGVHCVSVVAPIYDFTNTDVPVFVPLPYLITDVNACVSLNHTYDSDLTISLISPLGTTVDLSQNNGGSGDNYWGTLFDDEASTPIGSGSAPFMGSFIPDQALSAFDGENAFGNWTLRVYDAFGADEGAVTSVCLYFTYDEILPVELLGGLNAQAGDGRVALRWTTATETNNDHFEIQRDGRTVAQVAAAGNSTSQRNYTWTDNAVQNGATYHYTLLSVSTDGSRDELATASATPAAGVAVITEYALGQNYPNPFNPTTSISIDLVEAGLVSLKVYNLMGQEVATAVNQNLGAGRHTLTFDARGLTSGVYLYRLEVNGFAAEKKMLLMK